VLLIEDSRPYAVLVEQMLREGLEVEVVVLHHDAVYAARRALVEEELDCILLDLSLPDATGLEALEVVQSLAPQVPVVVLTGADDRSLALEAVQQGAQDYLLKRTAERELLSRSVHYAIERKRAESRLSHYALHDALTGLPNRTLLVDRLNLALARARRGPTLLAVLFLDLDRFKTVNDSLGHDSGDEVLVEVARRLQRTVRPADTVARFGGDEFLVLCEDLSAERQAVRLAERVNEEIRRPINVAAHSISLRASVGIAWTSDPDTSPQALIREADAAMYRAKRETSGIQLFEAAMHTEALNQLALEHELPTAIERGELQLHYQPELSIHERGRLLGAEALVRWQHPERGLLAPAEFIGVAEETGVIGALGEWVLGGATRQLARWRRDGLVDDRFSVSVNVSPRQLTNAGLVAAVGKALAASGVPPQRLCIEITESCIAHDTAGAARQLAQLKELGVTLALDDFGTGYSSLSVLRGYPIDVVKIDRSFIANAASDPDAARFFAAVVGVIRAAGLQAVAEGIETPEQLELVTEMRCELGQGFLFAAPTGATEFAAWLTGLTSSAASR
jgi:diguanylate cyclase (GGDEF)-like protein